MESIIRRTEYFNLFGFYVKEANSIKQTHLALSPKGTKAQKKLDELDAIGFTEFKIEEVDAKTVDELVSMLDEKEMELRNFEKTI